MSKRHFLGRIGVVTMAIGFGLLFSFLIRPQPHVQAAPAEPPPSHLHLLGHIGGEITVMQPMTNLLYAGIGADLAILDVSIPSTPTLLGSVTLGGHLSDIEIVGHYALVAGDQLGLHIVDIATPTAPQLITSTLIVSAPQQIAVYQNLAYVTYQAGPQHGLAILNMTNPAVPVVVNAKLGGMPFNPLDVQIWEQHLYVAGGSFQAIGLSFNSWGHLQVFALPNPTTPAALAHYQTPPGPGEAFVRLAVTGDHAYTVDDGTLRIFTVAQPAAPALLSSFSVAGKALQVTGQVAFIAHGPQPWDDLGELTLINIANPEAPQLLAKFPAISNIAVQPPRLFAAHNGVGLEVVDIATPLQPQIVGAYTNWVGQGSIVAIDSTVYLGGNPALFSVVAMSEPSQPQVTATYSSPTGRYAQQLLTDGLHLFALDRFALPTDADGVDIFTMNTPSTLQHRSRYSSTALFDAALQDNLLYLTTYHDLKNEIELVDMANPAAPLRIASVPLTSAVDLHNLVVRDKYVLLGAVGDANRSGAYASIHVIDISTPTIPKLIAVQPTIGFVWRLVAVGNRLYVLFYTADDGCRGGLEVIDITNLTAPVRLGYQCWPYRAIDLAVDGDYVYVTQGELSFSDYGVGRLAVFDATFPHALTELAVDRRLGAEAKISVADHTGYVTSRAGLFAYRYQPMAFSAVVTGAMTFAPDAVNYQFAAGAFTTPVTVTHTSKPVNGWQVALPLFALGRGFSNQAVAVADHAPIQPVQPYTVQIHYTDAEIALIDERSLALYQWVNGRWQREASSQLDPATNTVTAAPSTLGVWLVAGMPPHQFYLPSINKE